MYVGWNMNTNLLTITPETSLFKARELMDAHKISHLPVTDGKASLLGIVTDRDLKEAWASPATTLSAYELTYVLQKLNVGNIMTRKVITANRDMTIERAARIMQQHKIGALPVVEHGKLVGIITITDLMDVLLMALGMSEDSKRVSLLVRNHMKALAEVSTLMQASRINIRSIIMVPLAGHAEVWQIIMRLDFDIYAYAVEVLRDAQFKVMTEYVEDLTPHLPEGV